LFLVPPPSCIVGAAGRVSFKRRGQVPLTFFYLGLLRKREKKLNTQDCLSALCVRDDDKSVLSVINKFVEASCASALTISISSVFSNIWTPDMSVVRLLPMLPLD